MLHARPAHLGIDAAGLRRARYLGRDTPLGDHQRLADQIGQPGARVIAVAFLRAVTIGADDERSLSAFPWMNLRGRSSAVRIALRMRSNGLQFGYLLPVRLGQLALLQSFKAVVLHVCW